MATQTGSIDLTASNSVKLAAEAGWQSDLDSYYTKSEIDVTVSGINSTVSTKVGEDEVISSINQSSESVSINASKINLQGAVTISDLSSDAQNATLNSNIVGGGENLIGNFDFELKNNADYDYLTGTLTSTTTTNTRDNGVYIQFYTGTTASSKGTFVRQLDILGDSSNVGQLVHATFEKASDFTHFRVKFNGDKADSGVFWDISFISDGTQLTLSCTLDSISSDGKGNGGVLSGINLRTGNMPSRWSLAPQDIPTKIGGRNYAKTRFEMFPVGKSETRQSGVTATITGPSTFTLNGSATTTDWFFSAAYVFGGLTLQAGTYKIWYTSPNVNVRVGINSGGSTWFAAGTHCTKDNPLTLEITTEQAYYFTPCASVGDSYSNQEVRLMVECGDKPTDWSPAPEDQTFYVDDSVSSIWVGGRNLLKANDAVIKPTLYYAYDLYVTEPIESGQPYVLQLWDVDVSHSAKTAAQLGVNVYYCGGYVALGGWVGTNYFTSGHADHLTLYFTAYAVGSTVNSGGNISGDANALSHSTVTNTTKKYIRLYNSVPAADGTKNMSVGSWKLEKGNKATDWSPAPEDVDSAISNAAKTATSYVTDIDSNGITVHPSRSDYATNGGRAVINGNGLTVYLGSDDVASYGASARIGKSNSDRVTVDSTNGITIYKGNSKRLQTTANGIDVYGSDGTTSIASFGATARIGKSNGTRVTIDTSEVKIIPSNKTSNALTFTATDDYAYIGYGNNYLGIGGDVELGYDCALGVLGDLWVSSGGSLNVGSSAASGSPKFSVGSNGYVWTASRVEANYQLIAHDDTTSTDVALRANTAGNRGVYDVTNDKWMLFRNYTNNELYLGGSVDPLHHYTNTCTVNSTNATIYNSVNYCWHNNAACTVYLSVNLKSSLANASTVDVATAPENYRPPYAVMGSVYVTGQNVNLQAEILGAGTIRVNNRSGSAVTTSANIYMSFTFAL